MPQLTRNVFVETGVKGCNFGYVTTSDGIVMLDSPHKPSDALKLKAEITAWSGKTMCRRPLIRG
jgi:cyclase